MEFTINKDGMSLDIEMFASKKLLSNYVEKYINTIMEIQKRRELKTNSEITYITNDYVYLSTLIEDHLLSCGTDWSEIEEKYSYTKIIEISPNQPRKLQTKSSKSFDRSPLQKGQKRKM